ncbi:MAG: archease [Nitrospiraceae bacterium]
MPSSFRFLEDVALADVAFEARGESLSDLFVAAAEAVIDTMVNPSSVGVGWNRAIDHQNDDPASLLFDWLSDIVYLKDAEGVLFQAADAKVSEETSGVWRLQGTLIGEPIDPQRHELRSDVKAVTKHLYEVQREGGGWRARVVLDV